MHPINVKMKKLFLSMAMISLSLTFSVGYLNAAESYFPCPVHVNAGFKGKLRHVRKWGYINIHEKIVIRPRFFEAGSFSEVHIGQAISAKKAS